MSSKIHDAIEKPFKLKTGDVFLNSDFVDDHGDCPCSTMFVFDGRNENCFVQKGSFPYSTQETAYECVLFLHPKKIFLKH